VTALCVNGRLIPKASRLEPSRPSRPNAASSPIPATAGGSTSGSSTRVIASECPRNLRLARRNAAGVPKRRISVCAIRLVFRLTTNASCTTGFPSCSTSSAGDVCAKIATIGRSRNVIATTAAPT